MPKSLLKPCHVLAAGRTGVANGAERPEPNRMDARTESGVSDAVYSRLRSDILGGALLPGMKLKLDALRAVVEELAA